MCAASFTPNWNTNGTGRLQNPDLIPTDFSFDTTISSVSGDEKKMFIDFVQKMIRWDPSERSTAKELLKDPWLWDDD
jgi:serine/threonine protein kinase